MATLLADDEALMEFGYNFLKHSLAFRTGEVPELRYKPVTITKFQPKPRTY